MNDFTILQTLSEENKDSNLDRRAMGLSPALLQECCLQEHTLSGVFKILRDHMKEQIKQWNATCHHGTPRRDNCTRCLRDAAPQPAADSEVPATADEAVDELHRNGEKKLNEADYPSIELIDTFDWRLHEIRTAVMLVVENTQRSHAEAAWPQVGLQRYTEEETRMPHVKAAIAMMEDETLLNKALQSVKRDFTSDEPFLVDKMFLESALHQKILLAPEGLRTQRRRDLRFVLQAVMNKDYREFHEKDRKAGLKTDRKAGLAGVWQTAFATKDPHFLDPDLLGGDRSATVDGTQGLPPAKLQTCARPTARPT